MAQYGVLIYIRDSAHAPDATPEDIEPCDEHSDELVESGVQLAAYALTPRDMTTSIRRDGITDGPCVDAKERLRWVIPASCHPRAWRLRCGQPCASPV